MLMVELAVCMVKINDYAYYHCNHCKKYRVPAQQMNDDILNYIRQIRPCKLAVCMVKINDL